jgi:hypothetical protein
MEKNLPASIKKIATEVVANLKKMSSPEKKGDTFWNYLKDQLYSESTWDQNDLKVIENEIDKNLDKLDQKDLIELWKDTDKGWQKFEAEKKVDKKEMKADLTDEILGQVMDRMDDHYSSRDSYYTESTVYETASKEKDDAEKLDEDAEPADIEDEDLNLDEDIFNEDELKDDDDEASF